MIWPVLPSPATMPSPWMVALSPDAFTSMSITNRLDGAACVLLTAAWSVLIDTAASFAAATAAACRDGQRERDHHPTERQPSSHRALRPGIGPP